MPRITIEYRLAGEGWARLDLAPEAYFDRDPELAAGGWTATSVPEHAHAVDYLDADPARVEETRLTIEDEAGGRRFTQEIFWDEGRNRLIQRRDRGTGHDDRLILLSLGDGDEAYEVIRIADDDRLLALESHVRGRTAGGAWDEVHLYPRRGGEEGDRG